MNQKKLFGNFLRDPKTGLLWLDELVYHNDFIVHKIDGDLDLASCEEVRAEIVYVRHLFFSMSEYELIVAKDKNGHFAVLTLYHDTMGDGGMYASITPGFTFKTVKAFADHTDIYIIGENIDDEIERVLELNQVEYEEKKGSWGVIRINYNDSYWARGVSFLPSVIVPFKYDWDGVVRNLPNPMNSYSTLLTNGLFDLTEQTEDMIKEFSYDLGTPLSVIQECRGINPKPSHFLRRRVFQKKPIVAPSQPRGIVLDKNNKDEAKGRNLRVTLNGKVFEEGDAVEVYKEVLEDIGLDKVHETDLNVKGFKIVDIKPRTGFRWKCQDQIDKYWVYTKIGNPKKVDYLLKLKERFNLDMIIEAVD